jgi:hypothetical protein
MIRLGACDLPPLLEAVAAKHRSVLCRLEGNRGFLSASRTGHARLYPALRVVAGENCNPFGLTSLAPFGFVLEMLIVEEHLFARGESEIGAAVDALQDPVLEFH